MARIIYSLAQEGRGHASRGYEIISRLAKQGHNILVLTGGDTYHPLETSLQRMKNVTLRNLPGVRFVYTKEGNIDYAKTATKNIPIIMTFDIIVKKLKQLIDQQNFDFAISDFEPFLPRAAKSKKLNFITIDNQHKIVFGKKIVKKMKAKYIPSYLVTRGVVQSSHPLGSQCIITSVFKPMLRKKKVGKTRIITTGPMIRKEIEVLKGKVTRKDFLLVYVKPALERAIIPVLKQINQKFIMYVKNPNKYKLTKNIIYKEHSTKRFAQDMARCKAVVSSAGEQLMSEAIFLGKPLFLMPEGGQFEQILNGYSVKEAGVGDYKDIDKVKKEDITTFVKNLQHYKKNIKKIKVRNDTDKIMKIIYQELNRKRRLK